MIGSYKILAIIGEAGSGKDTLMQEVLKVNHNLHEIVSFTTRPPREGEKDGINYHFISGEEFAEKLLAGEMLEAACFNDWFYGTGFGSLRSDCVNMGVFNPEGIDSLMAHKNIELVVYYVTAKDKTRLLRQLNREENPNVDEIIRRYKTDKEDFYDLDFHYNELVNEDRKDMDFNVKVVSAAAQRLENRIG